CARHSYDGYDMDYW
nr:immunoglobulin heavy chain junction region [Mus musculus]